MNHTERRIRQLEKIFFPYPPDEHGFFWEELQFHEEFQKTFLDPDTAPDHLRRPYLLLHERVLRSVADHERREAEKQQQQPPPCTFSPPESNEY